MKENSTIAAYGQLTCIVIGLACSIFILSLRASFTLSDYPWMFPDSFDWLVNGLRYTPGSPDFEISHRAMLLPISFAFLSVFSSPNLIVLFGSFSYMLGAVILFRGLDGLCSQFVRLVSTLLYLLSPFILGQSAFVGADVVANALLCGMAISFLRFQVLGNSKYLLLSALFFAVGIHAQYINIIFLPTIALALMLDDQGCLNFGTGRRLITSLHAYFALGLALLVATLFLLPRFIEFGTIYEEKVKHASLIHFHFQSKGWAYYAASSLGAFTWPVVLLFLCGVLKGAIMHKGKNRALFYFMILWFLVVLGFFATLYTWLDSRFLIYISVPVYILAAGALESITNRFYIRSTTTAVILLFSQITASTDPFDMAFSLTPLHTFTATENLEILPDERTSSFYLLKHWEEAKAMSKTLEQETEFDTLANSRPLRALFTDLRNKGIQAENIGVYT